MNLAPRVSPLGQVGRWLSGSATVYRAEMRHTRVMQTLAGAFCLVLLCVATSALVLLHVLGTLDSFRSLQLWRLLSIVMASGVAICLGVILGAVAAPSGLQMQEVQAALLTHLTASQIVTGRIGARLTVPYSIVAASLCIWLMHSAFRPQSTDGVVMMQRTSGAHMVVALYCTASACCGFLCSLSGRPMHNRIAGGTIAIILVSIAVSAIWIINPLLAKIHNPTPIINVALLVNPAAAIASQLGLDILRDQWIYAHTQAHDYPFSYPTMTGSFFLCAGFVLCTIRLSALRLRMLFQRD